jgi:hypothetical protein
LIERIDSLGRRAPHLGRLVTTPDDGQEHAQILGRMCVLDSVRHFQRRVDMVALRDADRSRHRSPSAPVCIQWSERDALASDPRTTRVPRYWQSVARRRRGRSAIAGWYPPRKALLVYTWEEDISTTPIASCRVQAIHPTRAYRLVLPATSRQTAQKTRIYRERLLKEASTLNSMWHA